MEKVTGIGGIFIKSKNPELLAQWYKDHLGVDLDNNNVATFKRSGKDNLMPGITTLSFFKNESDYFSPSESNIMLNFRVTDLNKMLAQLNTAGCWIADSLHYYDYGSFGWTMDPEGNKIELWEPNEK